MAFLCSLKENFQGRLEAAQPSDRPRLAEEANRSLTEAVAGQGPSIEERTSIITVAQAK